MSRILIIAGAAVALAGPLSAQGKNTVGIPPGHIPPAGMCRIWVEGVPPGRQAAPTDCATAERTRSANSRVIYGAPRTEDAWRRGLVISKDRDALGRVIFRDASGRVVTRERNSEGWHIWRDANGTVLHRERVEARRADNDDLTKVEKERRKVEKERQKVEKERQKAEKDGLKTEKERLKAEGKAQKQQAKDARKLPRKG